MYHQVIRLGLDLYSLKSALSKFPLSGLSLLIIIMQHILSAADRIVNRKDVRLHGTSGLKHRHVLIRRNSLTQDKMVWPPKGKKPQNKPKNLELSKSLQKDNFRKKASTEIHALLILFKLLLKSVVDLNCILHLNILCLKDCKNTKLNSK